MPVFKSSPKRMRRLFRSGVIIAGPSRKDSMQSNLRNDANDKQLHTRIGNTSGALYMTEEQAIELREIFLELETEFYYADAFGQSKSNVHDGKNTMTDLAARAKRKRAATSQGSDAKR